MGLNPSVGGCGGISGSSGSVGGELFSQLGRGSSGSPVNTCTVASWLKRNAMTDPSTGFLWSVPRPHSAVRTMYQRCGPGSRSNLCFASSHSGIGSLSTSL
ncbi:hypothetical protein BDZ91DRAFT_752387 [Kalaharituber pfeilii]|nr:hypothetical protein BDZ91DRAFT_752387 [Kalaharituber pfeilii]